MPSPSQGLQHTLLSLNLELILEILCDDSVAAQALNHSATLASSKRNNTGNDDSRNPFILDAWIPLNSSCLPPSALSSTALPRPHWRFCRLLLALKEGGLSLCSLIPSSASWGPWGSAEVSEPWCLWKLITSGTAVFTFNRATEELHTHNAALHKVVERETQIQNNICCPTWLEVNCQNLMNRRYCSLDQAGPEGQAPDIYSTRHHDQFRSFTSFRGWCCTPNSFFA